MNGTGLGSNFQMKPEVEKILQKQAFWQKSRKSESWEEKIAKSAKARDSMKEFMSLRGKTSEQDDAKS